jgi:hypothetical protein
MLSFQWLKIKLENNVLYLNRMGSTSTPPRNVACCVTHNCIYFYSIYISHAKCESIHFNRFSSLTAKLLANNRGPILENNGMPLSIQKKAYL